MKKLFTFLFAAVLIFSTSCNSSKSDGKETSLSNEQIIDIAHRAYVFGYPMLLMDYTKQVSTNVETPQPNGFGPINQLAHFRMFPDDKFTAVVKPNVDTYYSLCWFDLKQEPVVFSVPASDRYYLLPLYDSYSNIFAVPGPRTTGTGAHTFLLTGPFWKGDVPEGMEQLKSPTNTVWLIGRTQVNSPEDGATVVKAFQDGMQLVPLSKYGTDYTPPLGKVSPEKSKIVPVENTRALSFEDYINKMLQLMVDNPPAIADEPLIKDMESIGMKIGEKFSTEGLSPELVKELNKIPEVAHQNWIDKSTGKKDAGVPVVNNWLFNRKNMGTYGTNYEQRAFIAFIGLGANLPEDAIYPSTSRDADGNQIMGTNKYIIHFDKGQTPPVNAFWSLTAYNSKDFLVTNPIHRFAIGDRNDLHYNEDGSLDIYLQNTDPGGEKTANWLPSTQEGLTNVTLRMYWPKESVLDGTWEVPGIKKVE